jgi:hypothetical protein
MELVDQVADAMLAALASRRAAAGAADASSSGEEDEEGDSDDGSSASDVEQDASGHNSSIAALNLLWRPELKLPSGAAGPPRPQHGAAASLAGGKTGALSKLQCLPPLDQRSLDRAKRGSVPDTAGKAWFDLPATAITDEVKADLRVLRLRAAFDPKTFYKKFDSTKFPKHFQMGTVVEGAADYYSSRMTRRERKRTLAEEVMGDAHLTQVRHKRYAKLQEEKGRWAGKRAGRKTDNLRLSKKPRKSKH